MTSAVAAGLYSALAAGTALTTTLGGTAIYYGVAPRTATLPYVIFNLGAGREENAAPSDSQRLVYTVQGVATTMLAAGTIADQIYALLHGATLSVSGYVNFWTCRESIVEYLEVTPDGLTIGHAGGEYAIRVVKN